MILRAEGRLLAAAALVLAAFVACAAPLKPESGRPGAPGRSIEYLLQKAQEAAAKKNIKAEIDAYGEIIKNFPKDARADAAYYRIGVNHFNTREYKKAIGYFKKVTKLFPLSRYYLESRIKTGIILVYLEKSKRAGSILKDVLSMELSDGQRSSVLYHIGQNEYDAARFSEALEWLAQCVEVEGAFRNQAKRTIGRIVHNFLSEEELLAVADRYAKRFPADIALIELMRIYWRNGDDLNQIKTAERFSEEFPDREKPEFLPEDEVITVAPVEEITIGSILPLSGQDAAAGLQILRGIQLAFSVKSGVVAERKVKLVIKDSASNPNTARAALAELGEDESVIGVVGPFTPDNLEAVMDISRQHRLPIITPAESDIDIDMEADDVSTPFFHTGITGRNQGTMLAELAVEKLRYYRLAVLYPDDEYGSELMRAFTNEAEVLGAEIKKVQGFPPDATDFGKQIKALGGVEDFALLTRVYKFVVHQEERILKENPELALLQAEEEAERDKQNVELDGQDMTAQGSETRQPLVLITPEEINELLEETFQGDLTIPYISKYRELPLEKDNFSVGLRVNYDALFIPGSYESAGLILPALAFYNIMGVQIIGSDRYASPELIKIGGKYSEGVVFTGEFMPNLDNKAVRNFVDNFENAFGETPDVNAARSYDAIMLLLELIESGADTKQKLAESIRTMKPFAGSSGEMYIGSDGKLGKKPFLLTVTGRKITGFELPFYLLEEPEF